jgi:hypothetical protein
MRLGRGCLAALLLAAAAPAAEAASAGTPRLDYLLHCSGCHGPTGAGVPSRGIPRLRGEVAKFLWVPEGRDYLVQVPGVRNADLDDAEIARLLDWLPPMPWTPSTGRPPCRRSRPRRSAGCVVRRKATCSPSAPRSARSWPRAASSCAPTRTEWHELGHPYALEDMQPLGPELVARAKGQFRTAGLTAPCALLRLWPCSVHALIPAASGAKPPRCRTPAGEHEARLGAQSHGVHDLHTRR